jgi:TPR repeat protein
MSLTASPWLIAALLGLLALSPARAGITPEEVKEFEGYKAQAEKGDLVAQSNLGLCYLKGEGVAMDAVQAVSWLRKAAEQGVASAQTSMGYCYANGFGVAKDEIEGYAYWNLAGITDEDARRNLTILEKNMSSDARLLGQQRTKQLQKEINGRLETLNDLRKAIERESLRKGA